MPRKDVCQVVLPCGKVKFEGSLAEADEVYSRQQVPKKGLVTLECGGKIIRGKTYNFTPELAKDVSKRLARKP